MALNTKNQTTLAAIFIEPVPSDLRWSRIEALFAALGATISERKGSRIVVQLEGRKAVFHRPHPEPHTDKGSVKSVRRFLSSAGVKP